MNGTGKTTTIAKLAYRFKSRGARVLLAAGDTFRAAAIEQLQAWAKRIDVPVVAHAANADPSAVVWDAMDAAAARGADVVIVDTAGRLHTKSNLMEELAKIRRTIAKRLPTATPEVLFVLDATTGQNGLAAGEGLPRVRRTHGHRADQARFHREGRRRVRDRARGRRAGAVRGRRGAARGPARLRPQRLRPGDVRLIGIDAEVAAAATELARRDPDLARLLDAHGPPPAWHRGPGFRTLVHVVLGQQVSLGSARSALDRLERATGSTDPASIVATGEDRLRAAGLTRQKTRYLLDLSSAVLEERLDIDGLGTLSDDAVIEALVAQRGVGRWTADIYLIMGLGRADVWPSSDLALLIAARTAKGLPPDTSAAAIARVAEGWRPFRSTAARMLWQDYLVRRERSLEG